MITHNKEKNIIPYIGFIHWDFDSDNTYFVNRLAEDKNDYGFVNNYDSATS